MPDKKKTGPLGSKGNKVGRKSSDVEQEYKSHRSKSKSIETPLRALYSTVDERLTGRKPNKKGSAKKVDKQTKEDKTQAGGDRGRKGKLKSQASGVKGVSPGKAVSTEASFKSTGKPTPVNAGASVPPAHMKRK